MTTVRNWILAYSLALCTALISYAANAQGSLTVAISQSLNNLDPVRIQLASEYTYTNLVFNGLTRIDQNWKTQPDLASSWTSNEDFTVWTFKLRDGVKFHNGKPLTADDVVWTFKRILDPKMASKMRGNLSMVETIEAVDPLTVKFVLKTPYSDFPTLIGDYQGRILPADYDDQSKHPIGTGPFEFVEYTPGDRLVLKKNPQYWEPDLPKLDGIQLRIIPESASATAALESGEVQIVADIRAEQVQRLASSKVARVDTVPSLTWVGFGLRQDIPPFNDIRVRQAFSLALDRAEATNIATLGQGVPTLTPIPPSHPYYNRSLTIPKADPEKAKALLAEAGYPNGLSIVLWYPTSDSEYERLCVVFRDEARKAGINVELRNLPADKFWATAEGKEPITITNFYGRPTADMIMYPPYDSAGSWNIWHYKSAEMDALLEKGRTLRSDAERKALYEKVQDVFAHDLPSLPVFVKKHSEAVRNNVQNFQTSPRILLELKDVWLAD
jgi:peptide/nickel transport system substrate-binding protein